MSKYRFKQVEPECCDFRFYFECDCYNANSGDFNNTIFPLSSSRNLCRCGLNKEDYDEVENDMDCVLTEIENLRGGWNAYKNIKEIMEDYKLPYNPKNAHILSEMSKRFWDRTEDFCTFLSIKTGKPWDVIGCSGYCQGDWCEIVYCTENYTEAEINEIGDIYLGCAQEFCLQTVDENDNVTDECYGFIVADSSYRNDADLKKLLCEWGGCKEDETELLIINGSHTYTTYDYEAV